MPNKQKLTGNENFYFEGTPQPHIVSDFWSWSMSRLLMDGPRGDLAEFIVRTALDANVSTPKTGWGECDIVFEGARVEVKCSSYLQEWERKTLSRPVFSIAKTVSCDIAVVDNVYHFVGRDRSEPTRRSDLYIFCLFSNPDRDSANPLMLEQWTFWVAKTSRINEVMQDKKTITPKDMTRVDAEECSYYELSNVVSELSKA